MLSSGKNVFEELGQGFALLAFGASDADAGAFADAARAVKVPLKVIRDTQAGGREAYEQKLTLVRPDQYVVWAGNSAPADTRALLAKAVGRS
jgi:4-hydroxyisophthalate hydroxylase